MGIKGLTIIGESINDSVPSTHALFEAGDIEGLLELARSQDAGGAGYIDVNVGPRAPEFMADLVRKIQEVTGKPLSIDTPDIEIARAGLEAYDPGRAGGAKPLLNSISPLRTEMFDLYKVRPFKPILLVSERVAGGRSQPCRTAEETCQAARSLIQQARDTGYGFTNDDFVIDPGIAPIASDAEGNLKRLIAAIEKIHRDPDLAGVHMSVGLSNFTVMLPPKRADGSPLKSPLESAFLTKAVPLGLDMVIGSVKRKYELLPENHPAMTCLNQVLKADGFDAIMRVRDFYS
ncbi:MAG: dihydropteroate synthase [Pirellulales bacterium]|nr:dihydropteroate synthase [Pirellulales bacterium]